MEKETFQRVVSECRALFTNDNTRGVWAFKPEAVTGKGNAYEKLSDVIHSIDGSEDYIYPWTVDALDFLKDYFENSDDAEGARDAMLKAASESVDVYNGDLTEWLAAHLMHLAWLDEVIEEYGCHGMTASSFLMTAQARMIEEIYSHVLHVVEELAENKEAQS